MRSPTTSTRSVRLSRSSMNPWGISPAIIRYPCSVLPVGSGAGLVRQDAGRKAQKPGTSPGFLAAKICESIQTFAATLFALYLLGVTLDGSSRFALTLGSRLFVKFATAHFRKYTGFFAGAFEATQGNVKWFVVFQFDSWHSIRTFIGDRWLMCLLSVKQAQCTPRFKGCGL